MSAWRKVFLRCGLIWTPYILAVPWLMGMFDVPGWPLGFSETTNYVLTSSILIPAWVVMCGGGGCLFRLMIGRMRKIADETGQEMWVSGPQWFNSYFFEVDEDFRLRP